MHNWRDGLKDSGKHLFGFGVPAAVLAIWFPWYAFVGITSLRVGMEIGDVQEKKDTLGKAVIDVLTSVILPLLVAIFK